MVEISRFGTHQGHDIFRAVLSDGDLGAEVLSFGAITKSLSWCGRELILGYPELRSYVDDPYALGIIAGRVANRTANARFEIDGKVHNVTPNVAPHHLHGGALGLGKRVWQMETDSVKNAVILTYHSDDGEEGYPAQANITISIRLADNAICYDMRAEVDAPTPIMLAQHNYYDLGPDMRLNIDADTWLETDQNLVPTGALTDAKGAFDFRTPQPAPPNLDHCYLLSGQRQISLWGANARLNIETDQIAVQAYASGTLGAPFTPNQAICLEPQGYPNAVNEPSFPSITCTPDKPYRQRTKVIVSD